MAVMRTVDARELKLELKVKVIGVKRMRARLWLALLLIRAAGMVSGQRMEVSLNSDDG